MWSYVSLARPHHGVLIIPKPNSRRSLSRPRLLVLATNDSDIGALGRTILNSLQSKPKPQRLEETSSNPIQDDQISGSDVLWAMKKVADKKSKRKKNSVKGRELLSSAAGSREEFGIGGGYQSDDDDSNVKPIVVKTEWVVELAELEKRLNELCDTQ